MTPESIISSFGGRRIVVLGDAVADQFLAGTISRISREAPVFILRHDNTATVPGAAANAAANIASLGGDVTLLSVAGEDENGDLLLESLESLGIATGGILRVPGLTTPTKTRVLAARDYSPLQQVIRIDREPTPGAVENAAEQLAVTLSDAASQAEAIVVSDYGYGVVSSKLFELARDISHKRGVPLIVDSRQRLTELHGATSATPNREEVRGIAGGECTDEICEEIRKSLGLAALLMTNGNKGMTVFEEGHAPFRMPAVGPTEPVDVTGAGDTVIAAYSLALAAGMSFRDAAMVANHAGGLVVMKRGTATITPDELVNSLRSGGSAFAKSR